MQVDELIIPASIAIKFSLFKFSFCFSILYEIRSDHCLSNLSQHNLMDPHLSIGIILFLTLMVGIVKNILGCVTPKDRANLLLTILHP
jgi:hypothetical protein